MPGSIRIAQIPILAYEMVFAHEWEIFARPREMTILSA
jgi:hypothetical protein